MEDARIKLKKLVPPISDPMRTGSYWPRTIVPNPYTQGERGNMKIS